MSRDPIGRGDAPLAPTDADPVARERLRRPPRDRVARALAASGLAGSPAATARALAMLARSRS